MHGQSVKLSITVSGTDYIRDLKISQEGEILPSTDEEESTFEETQPIPVIKNPGLGWNMGSVH